MTFATVLYRLEGRQLKEVRTVTSSEQGSEFIRDYQSQRIVLIQQAAAYEKGEGIKFHLVWMDEPEKVDVRMLRMDPGAIYTEAHLVELSGKGLTVAAQLALASKRTLVGLPLTPPGQQQPLPWTAFQHVVLMGAPGVVTDGTDQLLVSVSADRGLYKRIDQSLVVDLDLGISGSVPAVPYKTVSVFANNRYQAGFVGVRGREELKKATSTTVYIANKQTGMWKPLLLPTALGTFRTFGPWLAGYAVELAVEPSAESPGPRPGNTSTGIPAQARIANAGLKVPGLLLFFEVTSGRFYTQETGNADSEVLLIQGDDAYFRIDARLFRARITEKGLGNQAQIAEDASISDVHWAFFGP
ncbi:MAG: hypothetical protein ACE15E_25005 [Acidobacteriota bacterium]